MEIDTNPAAMEALESLATLLGLLQEAPLSYSLHYQHLALAKATGLDEELRSARDMFTSCLAVSDGKLQGVCCQVSILMHSLRCLDSHAGGTS